MSNLIPQKMSHQELAELLQWAIMHIEEHDSFEGNIAWEIPDPPFEEGVDCLVHGVIRFGNSEGQGSIRMIGTIPKVKDDLLVCNHRWMASRIEVETAPVEHVCNETMKHRGEHICSCGAKSGDQ